MGPGTDRTRWTIAWFLSLILGGMLFYAAFLKGLDPALFADQITEHKVSPASWSPFLAHFFIAIEMIVAFALALRLWPRLTHLGFIAMMVAFIGITAWAWAHGNSRECGCFGRAVSRGPKGVIIEDGIFIAISAVALFLWRGSRTPRWSLIATVILALPSLAFTAIGARLPADSLVTDVRAGTDFTDVPIEDLRTPQSEGSALMVLVQDGCAPCEAGIPALNDIAHERPDLNVFAVYAGSRQEAVQWRLRILPAFPVAHGSARAMRAYYRTLPAAFLLRDGKVVRAFWGRIPTLQEVMNLAPQS